MVFASANFGTRCTEPMVSRRFTARGERKQIGMISPVPAVSSAIASNLKTLLAISHSSAAVASFTAVKNTIILASLIKPHSGLHKPGVLEEL